MKIIIIACVIILFSIPCQAFQNQVSSIKFKRDALLKINYGQFGEAINLLNKYISENPQDKEGYILRAECYQERGQYELAVYDYRSALKLSKNDSKISKSLNKVTDAWYAQLYNKIEGHKREIAINPLKPNNYLQIGICYKNLGNWQTAEEWYDKYIKLEEPSPDEVIRYTEILAKNNHLRKGEEILKKFVEKYPEDHRLWSRYGYFTLWSGKNKIAIAAFSQALQFRPFFKEAIDGLYLAQGKGSIYTVNDTSYQYHKYSGTFRKKGVQEYPIDKYFRLLRHNPKNDSVRIILIHELLKAGRINEAKEQYEHIVKSSTVDESTRINLNREIQYKWEEYVNHQMLRLGEKFKSNPNDSKIVEQLGNFFQLKNNADNIVILYSSYLKNNPRDDKIRYDFARKLSWFKNFEEAKEQVDLALMINPSKMEYQLLRAQIAVWTNSDLDLARDYLSGIIQKDPSNLEALSSLAELNYQTRNFPLAEQYIAKIEKIDSNFNNLDELKRNIIVQKKFYEELQLDSILTEARKALTEKNCTASVEAFKIFLNKNPENDKAKLELANAYICSNDYQHAIEIYSELINKHADTDLIKQRAKLYFWAGDYVNALAQFKSIYSNYPNDFESKLFLADSYFNLKDYDNSRKLYYELLDAAPSSILIKNRINWLPGDSYSSRSFSDLISNFPTYTLLTPELYFFKDNLSFKYKLQGIRAEAGITDYLSLGVSIYRGNVSSDSSLAKFFTMIGTINLIPIKLVTASLSFGKVRYFDLFDQNISDIILKISEEGKYSVSGSYKLTSASQTLYSPFLVDTQLTVTEYLIDGMYRTPNQIILSGSYSYKKISDENKSYDLYLKLGKNFNNDLLAGYEYHYLNYILQTPLYYSPNQFESHSLWADYKILNDDAVDFSIGGKIGIIANNDILLKELNSKLGIKIFDSFTLQAQLALSENARETVNYKSSSVSLIAFWIF